MAVGRPKQGVLPSEYPFSYCKPEIRPVGEFCKASACHLLNYSYFKVTLSITIQEPSCSGRLVSALMTDRWLVITIVTEKGLVMRLWSVTLKNA